MTRVFSGCMAWFLIAIGIANAVPARPLYEPEPAAPPIAKRLPGSWKTHFAFPGAPEVSIYTFNENGEFKEEAYDQQGKLKSVSPGSWEYRDGEVRITWRMNSFEHAVLTWKDNNTIEYHVVRHTDKRQIGLRPILHRLGP